MTTKTFTHSVRVPPMTDVPEMVGAYRSLFETQQIDCSCLGMMFMPNPNGFTHPIETENQILVADFMNTMSLIQSAVYSYGKVKLTNVRAVSSSLTFVFDYEAQE